MINSQYNKAVQTHFENEQRQNMKLLSNVYYEMSNIRF